MLAQARRALRDVPREVDPGTETLSQYGVSAGSRPSFVVATPRDGRSRAAHGTGRDEDLVALEHELALPARPARHGAIAGGVALDPLDRGVDDVAAGTSAHVLVERLEVAEPQRREREHRRVHGPRRGEHDRSHPRQKALRELEPELRLPTMTMLFPA